MIKRLQAPSWRVLAMAGFFQSLGVIVYCIKIAFIINFLGNNFSGGPNVLGMALFLLIFVLSAAITGSLVFGYAAYLALSQKIREALMNLAYVFLWSVFFLLIATLATLILIWYNPSLFT